MSVGTTDDDGNIASDRATSKQSGAAAKTSGDDERVETGDESSMSSSSGSSSASFHSSGESSLATSCSGSKAVIRTTQVKTIVRPARQEAAGEPASRQVGAVSEMRHEREVGAQHGTSTGSSTGSSSTFKRYKFGLTNHFLTMPDVAGQQDAKFYQAEAAQQRARDRKRQRSAAKSRAGDARQRRRASSSSSPATGASNQLALGIDIAPARNNSSGSNNDNAAAADSDDCDLSVLAPSSPGSNLSSLLPDDWTQSQEITASSRTSEPPVNRATPIEPRAPRQPNSGAPQGGGGGGGGGDKTLMDERLAPAGDAGLDASKCNSKAANECYLAPAYLHHHHNHQGKFSAASGTLTPASYLKQRHLKGKKRDEGEECGSNSLLVRFSSIMYATFLVILGCILHVSELRQKSRNSSDHIYTTVVALLGIFWLVFLQMDLQRYKRYASKYILLESLFNDQQRLATAAAGRPGGLHGNNNTSNNLLLDPTSRSTTSSSASLVNDRMSMNTEVIFKKTAYKMYQQRAAAYKPTVAGGGGGGGGGGAGLHGLKLAGGGGQLERRQQAGGHDDGGGQSSTSATSNQSNPNGPASLVPAYKFLHGKMGANFYLKCGMAAFCFGHVIHEGLRFGQQVYFFATSNLHCRDSAALIAHLVTPLYSFYQLFMMFKYSNLVINRHKILAKFGLMHIIGTCVTFWFRTILEEAFEDFVHKMDYFKAQNKPVNQFLDPTSSFRDNSHNLQAPSARPTSWLSSLASLTSYTSAGGGSEAPFQLQNLASSLGQTVMSNWTQLAANNTSMGRSNQQALVGAQNVSLAQTTLLALMSSPISANISPQLVRHIPDSYHCAQNTLLTTKSMNALPYLYPFTIEYNLLIAATFLSLYFNIGKIGGGGGGSPQAAAAAAAARCSPSCCQHHEQAGKPKHLAASDASAKVYLNSRHLNGSKQPSLASSHYNAEFSDHNNAGSIQLAPSSYFRHSQHSLASSHQQQQHHQQQHRQQQQQLGAEHMGEYKSNFVVNADCHAANKGLFLGFFVLLVTLVTIVIFFVTINKPSHLQLGLKINLIQEATLTSLILIVTLAGYRQIMRLNKNPHTKDRVTTDDVLMLIPLPFFFIHSLLSFRAETATLYAPSHLTKTRLVLNQVEQQLQEQHFGDAPAAATRLLHINQSLAAQNDNNGPTTPRSHQLHLLDQSPPSARLSGTPQNSTGSSSSRLLSQQQQQPQLVIGAKIDRYKLLTIALNLAVMVEVLVQTNFIIEGLRRCSESRYLRFKKPGRELITFAIILNITYWIVATFETKSVEQYKTEIEYYGPLPYMFISHTTLPVMLFYRYHSSVCLAEIWNRAYKSPKER